MKTGIAMQKVAIALPAPLGLLHLRSGKNLLATCQSYLHLPGWEWKMLEFHRFFQVSKYRESEILDLHGMGIKALAILRAALEAQGFSFNEIKK